MLVYVVGAYSCGRSQLSVWIYWYSRCWYSSTVFCSEEIDQPRSIAAPSTLSLRQTWCHWQRSEYPSKVGNDFNFYVHRLHCCYAICVEIDWMSLLYMCSDELSIMKQIRQIDQTYALRVYHDLITIWPITIITSTVSVIYVINIIIIIFSSLLFTHWEFPQ